MLLAERPRPEFTLEPNIGEDPFSGCAGVRGRVDHRFLAASTFSPCNLRRNSADFIETTHFLRSCFLCMGRLHPRGVIYMYRGDRAFCSERCRKEQMIQDECSFASKKEAPLAASEGCSAKGVTVALKGRGSRESMPKSHISYLLDEVCEESPCVNSVFASCKEPNCKENEDNGKAVKYCGNCKQSPNPSTTLESSSREGLKELGMEPENKGIISDFLSFVGMKESYKSKGKSWTRFYFLYDPRGTEKWRSLIATMANYLEFNMYNLDLTSLSSLSDLTNKLASIMNRSLILIQDFDHCAGMLSDLNATELTGPCLLEFVNGLLLSCGDERIIVFTTNNRDLHAAALHTAALRHPFNEDIYIHKSSPPLVALPDEGEIVQVDSSKQNETEAATSSFKWAFQLEGLTTQSTAYPNPSILVFPQLEIASTEVLSENMESSKDGRNLLASQQDFFLEGHVSKSSNLAFPACSDAAAPSQLVATILPTSPAIPHMIPPNFTGGSSETFQLGGQSTQSTAYPNHNSLVFPQPQIALTQIRSENMGSSEDWRASQQEPTCSGPSPSQPPMPTTPYTMHRIPHVMPPLTSSQDASSVKLKATYRDTIIEFQFPVSSGIIELKEEVAMILKLELDSFDVKYKDEEGEGDWVLIPCDKDLRNYLQLLSSLVNPVIRLLVVDKDANLTNLDPMALKQPAKFMESGIDPDNNGIISDLLRFVSKKEIYKKAGKAWMRFYLLYEPPGADRSSLIAAMANYLEFDICDLDLRSVSSILELKNMLSSTPNRSLIAVQDIDHCAEMLPNLKNELTVSCLLKYIDGLFSRCGDERIIVFTTNHRDRHNASLLPLVNLDIYIPASSPQPIALPDGGDIVQLESSEKKPLMDFDPANNKEYHSGVLVSSSKNNNMREASKRRCMKKIVLSLVDPMIGISLADFDAPNNGAHLVGACQSGPIMSNSEKKDTGEGLNGDFLTKSVLGLEDSTKRNSLPDFDATESKARLLIAYQSGPVVSRLENKNSGEALKRECITKSILGLEDLQQHSGGRRDDAVKSFATIYDPGIHMTDSFARKSFEVQETLRPWEQPRNAISTDQEREIWTQMCLEQSDARAAHSVHVNTYARQFRAHLFPSWCHSVCIRCIFGEPPDDFVPLLSLRRLMLKCCVRKEKSPYFPRLLQINAVEPRLTKSPRYSGGSFAKSASRGPISLQDGTHVVMLDPLEQSSKIVAHAAKADQCSLTASLPEKKMMRRKLKRKYGFISVIFENHQQHFRRRFEGAVKSFHATHICRKHGINRVSRVKSIYMQHGIQQWPFRQKWETRMGYSLGYKRPFEVSSLSMGEKLDSRLLFIHMYKFVRSSPLNLALPDQGKIIRPIVSSSSEFAGPNDRPHLVKQHQSSSTASHYERKNTRETSDKEGITMSSCSVEDHQKSFGCKHKDADEQLSFDATNNKAHHVKADQSGPTLSNSEKENTRVAVKGECGTKGRGGFHTPDSLGPKSFKVLVTLPLRQLSSGIRHLVSRYSRRRLTFKCCVQLNKSWNLPRTLQMNCSEGLTGQSGTPLHWSNGLPDGEQVVSPSIERKTLKRKCRTTKVRRPEYHQLHFDSRCQDAGKRYGAKRICRQHVINQVSTMKCIHRQHGIHWWPFGQKWAMMKVYSLEGQRPLQVISLSMGWKLVSRLQVIHVSWLGRSSPEFSAIPGGEIVGLIVLSSSGFAATNNRANLVGQNSNGSTASHSNTKKRRRDAAVGKGINFNTSEQDIRQCFGLTRKEAAKHLGVSVTTLKRRCRDYGIMRWPCNRNGSSDVPGRPPDPDEMNTYQTCNASTHGQTEMVGHLPNPNEVPRHSFDGVIAGLLETTTSHDAYACNNLDMEVSVSSFLEDFEASGSYEAAFQHQEQITVSFAYPTQNYPVCAQPHIASKEMASDHPRSSNLTSQVEACLEGHGSGSTYLMMPTSSNPALSQTMSTIPETGPTVLEPMSINPDTGPAIPQPMSTLPDTAPTIMTIKAKYTDSTIKFKLPLTSTLAELNEKVEMRLNLKPGSFDVEYKDEDEDEGWILIACNEDLSDYLQLFSSLDNPVIKLVVLDKVVNANESSGSLKRKRP